MRSWFPLLLFTAGIAPAESRVIAVNIDSVIHPVTVEILSHAIEQARREKAEAVLIRLNTPGGLMEATRQAIERIDSSPVPVITLVTPSGGRAASAGFLILLSGDVAAMIAGTHTGAASPISLGGPMDPVLRKKVESDASAQIRSLAARHQRDGAIAEKAVLEAKSFTSEEALKHNLIDMVVRDEAELWSRLDNRTVTRAGGRQITLHSKDTRTQDYVPTVRERVVMALADPNLAFLILVLGGLLLYVEFSQPGMILPGVAGVILMLLGLLALSVLPINGAAVALLLLAVALFVLEAKVISHGVLAAGGVVSMVLGALLLVEGPPEMRIRLGTALGVSIPFALITVFLMSLVIRARMRPSVVGSSAMLQETGVAWTDLSPNGTVFIRGEYWNATAESPIPRGSRVRVSAVDGLRLKVTPAP